MSFNKHLFAQWEQVITLTMFVILSVHIFPLLSSHAFSDLWYWCLWYNWKILNLTKIFINLQLIQFHIIIIKVFLTNRKQIKHQLSQTDHVLAMNILEQMISSNLPWKKIGMIIFMVINTPRPPEMIITLWPQSSKRTTMHALMTSE